MNVKALSRLRIDPFSIDIRLVMEDLGIVELVQCQ